MTYKSAAFPQRVTDIPQEEKAAAKNIIDAFSQFLKKLWAARQHDNRLVNVLKGHSDADSAELYEIRHLLRRFQREANERYTELIFLFAGKKDKNMETAEKGIVHLFEPLERIQ